MCACVFACCVSIIVVLCLALQAKLLREMSLMKKSSRCFPMLLELGMKPEAAGDKVEEELSALSKCH